MQVLLEGDAAGGGDWPATRWTVRKFSTEDGVPQMIVRRVKAWSFPRAIAILEQREARHKGR